MITQVAVLKNRIAIYKAIDLVLRWLLHRIPSSPLAEKIALWWGYRFRPEPGVVKLRSGALLRTNHVDHLQLLLYYCGTFEPVALEVMRRHLKNGDTVLDVGANIGLFTIEGAKIVGPAGHVISIEAAPIHANSVRESARVNGMNHIDVVAVAVGDADSQAILTLPEGANHGMFTLGDVAGDERLTVPVRRIDDLIGERKIDFIKMDIEGSEYRALKGAESIISKLHPPILVELNESALRACGSSTRQVKEFLFKHGYKGTVIGSTIPITLDQHHTCDECLFIALVNRSGAYTPE